jgi:hypothetical protein
LLRIAFAKFNGQVFGLGPDPPAFQQSWNIVSADGVTTAPCGRECRVSASRGNVQYAPTGLDLNQLVFEITAMMFRANFAWIVTADERVLDQARLGIRNILTRVAGKKPPSGRARQPKKRVSPNAEP